MGLKIFAGGLADQYCKAVIKHPMIGMLSTLVIAMLISAIGFQVFPFDIDTSPSTFNPRTTKIGQLEETRIVSEEHSRFNPFRNASDLSSIEVPLQSFPSYGLVILFSSVDGQNLLTEERFNVVKQLESGIQEYVTPSNVSFKDVCLKDRITKECIPFQSLSSYLYASSIPGCPGVFYPDGKNTSLSQPLDFALQSLVDPALTDVYCSTTAPNCNSSCIDPTPTFPHFATSRTFGYEDDNATLSSTLDLSSHLTRTQIQFGIPLKGYSAIDDRYDDQIAIIEDFVSSCQAVLDQINSDGFRITFIAPVISEAYFWDIVLQDTALVSVSILVVFLYVWFHTESLFLASFGMLHILLSFPIAYFITQLMIDFGGMSVLNLMSLFIILGVGADDIFLAVDRFKQSEWEVPDKAGKKRTNPTTKEEEMSEENRDWLVRRLIWSYKHSTSSMLITSLTTAAAFFMNATSAITAVQIFGIFTGLMIVFNFLLVITYFPFVMVVYQRHVRFWPSCWTSILKLAGKKRNIADSKKNTDIEMGSVSNDDNSFGSSDDPDGDIVNIKSYRKIERFFYGPFSKFINSKRWYIIAGFVVVFAVFLYFGAQLSPSKTPTQWLPSDDPLQIAFNQLNNEFGRIDVFPQIIIMFGLLPVDQSKINSFNPADVGRVRYDPNFDPSAPNFQENFISICERIRVNGEYVLESEVYCPMEDFRDYVLNSLGRSFPVPNAELVNLLANFTAQHEVDVGPAPDYSGSSPTTKQDPTTRSERSQSISTLYQAVRFKDTSGDPEIASLSIIVNTTLGLFNTAKTLQPVYDTWQQRISDENARSDNIESTLNNAFQTCYAYIDLQLETSLLNAAILGIGASMALSFVIILLMTHDFWLSLLCISSIFGVVVTILGFIVMIGWSLSLIESLCLTILVGLSVDYVIHLAHVFQISHCTERPEKVRHALVVMGISVLSAGITTFLSSFILFFSYIIFFFKFGLFIAFTIFFSCLWAFGFFMALVAVMGPKKKNNHFLVLWRLITCQHGDSDSANEKTEMSKKSAVVDNENNSFPVQPIMSIDEI
eukprot:m.26034 g.26034  ORF g.26034 m.26034 type:complete len:1057 (-) comp5820_c2_seq1:163-3333(-)